MRSFTLPAMLAAATLAVGCAGSGTYGYTAVSASAYGPELAYVSPGVSVIADYNEPIFYSDSYYWRYANNGWYRSPYYDRGWSYYARPPIAVARIQSPYRYRNYRPPGYVVRRDRFYDRSYNRGQDRGYRHDRGGRDRTVIRDHRRR